MSRDKIGNDTVGDEGKIDGRDNIVFPFSLIVVSIQREDSWIEHVDGKKNIRENQHRKQDDSS